ncbi:hypothetical protein FB451DRAFT_1131708 [Mycena latifolia]|nr:hypothetical protein FB451DRAFT_1131708 [Mycena latifolia]
MEVCISNAQEELGLQKQKTSEARARCQNTRRREERAHNTNSDLQEHLAAEEAVKDELLTAQQFLEASNNLVNVLAARNSALAKSKKVLTMRVRRAPTKQEKAVAKVKKDANVFRLQNKGLISDTSRELVTDLVALHNVPVSKILSVIKTVAQSIGVTVEGNISERSVGRIVLESGLIAQAQVIHKVQHAPDVRMSGDGTSLHNIQPESKFLNYSTTLYAGDNSPGEHVNRFLGITTAVNHTAETQLQGWKDVNRDMHEIYNSTVGVDKPVDPDTLPAKVTAMTSDHAPDQKKLARGVGGPEGWKEECDRKLRGQEELRSWKPEDFVPFIMAASAKKVEEAGGLDVYNDMSTAEQDTLNKSMFTEVCVQVGKDVFNAMSPEQQRAADLFIWAGCCMHKELNAVKGGNAAMIASYIGHDRPIPLMNKDNKAAAAGGSSSAKARAETVSEGGGVKLTSLAGMLFNHKDKKKGEGALFHIWFETKLGYAITFPDTSNTRYQSHCEAAGMLLLHRDLFLRYLEHMRDRKGTRRFTNVEQNVYDGLRDPRTETELTVLAAYGQSLSHPYLSEARGEDSVEKNLLELGPLHEHVKSFCRAVVANPDVILGPNASWATASMDGKSWDNPELFYKIMSRQNELPGLRECLVSFFGGALDTWERFSEDYAEGGIISEFSADERKRAWLPTTNDVNEGTLGERRNGSRHAPNMTLEQHNARKMYKRNNTKKYRPLLFPKSLRVIRAKARMFDSSGLTRKRRKAQQDADDAVVGQKRNNDVKKATKQKSINDALDKITPWTTETRVRHDPDTGKEPTNKALDDQLAWHRRAEKLPKGVKSDIPGVSKLSTKAHKTEALISAMHRHHSDSSEGDLGLEDVEDEPIDEADSDVDMELSY